MIYYKNETFCHDSDIKEEYMQLSKFCSTSLNVITIYRSQSCSQEQLIRGIKKLVILNRTNLVTGDFNFCYQQQKKQTHSFFTDIKFVQLVNEPTHIGGHILDQAYLSNDIGSTESMTEIHAKYYSDH